MTDIKHPGGHIPKPRPKPVKKPRLQTGEYAI